MITLDQALALIEGEVGSLGSETVPIGVAAGRVLAEPLVARSDAPRHAVSAMDGYAVIEATTVPGTPLHVVGESRAGCGFGGTLREGQAVRIFTGAPLPAGADYVVMQEYATREGDSVTFAEGYGPASHVRPRASDFAAGAELVAQGTRLDARAMVAAAAADRAEFAVTQRPRVAIFATGDELAPPGSAHLSPETIPDSVSFGIAAMVEGEGAILTSRRTGVDDLEALVAVAGALLEEADLVVLAGGASVGDRDFAKPMFAPHGLELLFEKIAMKPGKPVWLGRAKGKLVLGLPGNPTSAMVTATIFLRPILARLQGASGEHRWRSLPLAGAMRATGSRETLTRARWEDAGVVPAARGGVASLQNYAGTPRLFQGARARKRRFPSRPAPVR